MNAHPDEPCLHAARTERLAAAGLAGAEQHDAEQHVLSCDPCLALFQRLTRGRFPRIPQYTFLARIGEGGFGVVYKALHHEKQRIEAVKLLFEKSPTRVSYFQNEVRLVAGLQHPNIATLYEAQLSTPPLYFSMEYVEGRHLGDVFQQPDVSLVERLRLIRIVAEAVSYAHSRGVVHRDLKPQNILIDAAGQPRILDFGIAKRLAEPGRETVREVEHEGVLGTYGYIAPEQVARQASDHRADVYALGALLFHAVTGEHPRLVTRQERIGPLLRKRQVTRAADLAAIIRRCVAVEPARRYPSGRELCDDLDHYVAARPVSARTDRGPFYGPSRVLSYVLRGYPAQVAAALGAASAALLTLLLWNAGARWYRSGAGEPPLALVAIQPSTVAAIAAGAFARELPALRTDDRKTWRQLYGLLLERLAPSHPRAVVFDVYFPDCRPEHDEALLRGIAALGAPVVVGSLSFDINAAPAICPDLRAAIYAVGTIEANDSRLLRNELEYVLCIRRGFEPPIPGLAVAAFAAARRPQAIPQIELQEGRIELRYRKQQAAPQEARWHAETDLIPFHRTGSLSGRHRWVQPDDRIVFGRLFLAGALDWEGRAIPLEAVLMAAPSELEAWFRERVVMVGQMLPGEDRWPLAAGGALYGCSAQAEALAGLLAGEQLVRFTRPEVAVRVIGWCIAGVLLGRRLRLPRRWRLSWVAAGLLAVSFSGVVLAAYLAVRISAIPLIELGTLASCLLTAGALAALAAAVQERELHLAPGPTWNLAGTTLASTLVRPTHTLATGTGGAPPESPAPTPNPTPNPTPSSTPTPTSTPSPTPTGGRTRAETPGV